MTSLEDMRRELRQKYDALKGENPDGCRDCISELVHLVEIPHMIYRTYPEMSDWYLSLLKRQSEELQRKGCITNQTEKKLLMWHNRIEEAVKRERRPYEETEAVLSVLKSESVTDVAKFCGKIRSID